MPFVSFAYFRQRCCREKPPPSGGEEKSQTLTNWVCQTTIPSEAPLLL
jgi:hypothetical protein